MITLSLRDKSFSHCIYSNNPLPPVSFAKYIEWDRTTINNKTIYTDLCINEAPANAIAWLIEPRELISNIYEYVERNATNFKSIWTHDEELLKKCSNAVFVPLGGCWIKKEDRKIYEKSKMFSIIASDKRYLEGHKLRHEIISAADNKIDTFGGGYKYIPYKLEGLKDYRFHIVVENTKKNFWFTEKLIDCFATGTIPVYWGCPMISKYFNEDGMVVFNDLLDLKQKLKQCTPDFYNSKISAIKENFDRAQKFVLAEDWIYENDLHLT